MTIPAPRRALIADDHSLYRRGLALFLKDQFAVSEITEVANFEDAVAAMSANSNVDVALFDLLMPGMNGPQSLAQLRASHPNTKIAIVAASEYKEDILAAIATGLNGFIPKSLTTDEFTAAVETILAGRVYVPGLMMSQTGGSANSHGSADGHAETASIGRGISSLTPRQKEVLDCIRRGMTNRDIAAALGISIGTVKIHVAALLQALNVANRIQLANT